MDLSEKVKKSRKQQASELARALTRSILSKSHARPAISDSTFHSPCPISPALSEDDLSKMSDQEIIDNYMSSLENLVEKENIKTELKKKSVEDMRTFLKMYKSAETKNKAPTPRYFVVALKNSKLEKRFELLEELFICCNNLGISWIKEFDESDILELINIFNGIIMQQARDKGNFDIPIVNCCVRIIHSIANTGWGFNNLSQKANVLSKMTLFFGFIMNFNLKNVGDRSLLDSGNKCKKTVLELLSVFLHRQSDVVLRYLNEAASEFGKTCFQFITDGLSAELDSEVKARYLLFVKCLFTCKDYELDYRIHIRSELMRCGFDDQIKELRGDSSSEIQQILDVLDKLSEEDYCGLCDRYETIALNWEDTMSLFQYLRSSITGTMAEKYLLSLLQHLLLIRDEPDIRNLYYSIIDECVSQIVLRRNGADPDFSTSRFDIDVKAVCESIKSTQIAESKLSEELETCVVERDEMKAKLKSLSTKLHRTEQQISALKSELPDSVVENIEKLYPLNVSASDLRIESSSNTGANVLIPTPAPPPLPPLLKQPSQGVPPPPPLFIGDSPGVVCPIPPPPLGGLNQQVQPSLPSFLNPKKKYVLDAPIKKLPWNKVNVFTIKQNSLWASLNEENYRNATFLTRLANDFCTKSTGKDLLVEKEIKREKLFEVLDNKTGQNFAIVIGALKASPEKIFQWILECNEKDLSYSALEQIGRFLPESSTMSLFKSMKSKIDELREPEKLLVLLSDLTRLKERTQCLCFKRKFTELISELKPFMISGSHACQKIHDSTEIRQLFEIILTIGNYMNSSTKNYECAYGFDLRCLPKLIDTKSSDNKRSLLHFVVETADETDRRILGFFFDFDPFITNAAKINQDQINSGISELRSGLKMIDNEIDALQKCTLLPKDKFIEIMTEFSQCAVSQFETLEILYETMMNDYKSLADYLTFDYKKYPIGEFFMDLKTFVDQFKQCSVENENLRKVEKRLRNAEVNKRVSEERRKQFKKKQERLKPGDEEENILETFLEQLKEPYRGYRTIRIREKQRITNARRVPLDITIAELQAKLRNDR